MRQPETYFSASVNGRMKRQIRQFLKNCWKSPQRENGAMKNGITIMRTIQGKDSQRRRKGLLIRTKSKHMISKYYQEKPFSPKKITINYITLPLIKFP